MPWGVLLCTHIIVHNVISRAWAYPWATDDVVNANENETQLFVEQRQSNVETKDGGNACACSFGCAVITSYEVITTHREPAMI